MGTSQAPDYTEQCSQRPRLPGAQICNFQQSGFAAGRISYVLGLQGPCTATDTACSSSLVACHSAVRALQLNEGQLAVLAGVHVMLVPYVSIVYATGQMTSRGGRSHTFDARADGFGRGEGCGSALLGMDESRVVAHLAGVAVRQDGKSVSLTAPNGQAQRTLLRVAHAEACETDIECLEAHGTGTALGDPIEAGAIGAAGFSPGASKEHLLGVSGVKASVGHAEPAAGILGMLKLALEIERAEIASNAQLRVLNRHLIQLVGGQLIMPTHPTCVSTCTLERVSGGVSSFGLGGTIAHAVLRQVSGVSRHAKSAMVLAFQRYAFKWREPPHPFVQHHVHSLDGAAIFRSPAAAGALHALVANHVVQGRAVFPGVGYLEMARAAARGGTALRDVFFLQPLAVESAGLLIECSVRGDRFEVRSGAGDDLPTDAALHCSGAAAPPEGRRRVRRASLRARTCADAASIGVLYNRFEAVGLQYGPGYRTLVGAWGGTAHGLARLRARAAQAGTAVHPADLGDAVCTSALLGSSGGGETRLPFAVDTAELQAARGELWAVRRVAPNAQAPAPRPSAV